MNKNLYRKLAWQNIQNNTNTFFPFGICTTAMTAMFYMLSAICEMSKRSRFYGDAALNSFLNLGIWITAIFAFFVILYTNSFLMKRRAKEFGLYSMLGMEKRHIGKIVFWEIAMISIASISIGLIIGMLFSKLIFLVLIKLTHIQTNVVFHLSVSPIVSTIGVFLAFFGIAVLLNFVRIARLKPIDLMRSTKIGEKEPKAKWLLTLFGILCLGTGYFISITVENPVQAVNTFFIAVLFVIAGTYLLFISGSIALLKILKNNKHFYYQKNHFVTVSGLIYRMKQNAVGLASICILSTMVLVTIFSTVALYSGTEDGVRTMCPTDIVINVYPETEYTSEGELAIKENPCEGSDFDAFIADYAARCHVTVSDKDSYYVYVTNGLFDGNRFCPIDSLRADMSMVFLMTAKDYESHTGAKVDVESGEAMVYSKKKYQFPDQTIRFGEKSLSIKGTIPAANGLTNVIYVIDDFVTIVVKDRKEIGAIAARLQNGSITYNYGFNVSGNENDVASFCNHLDEKMKEAGYGDENTTVTDIYSERDTYMSLYGSLLFIGIFIGFLFLAATVMIIYYKQISEGYEDRERFVIMKKVGMSDKEVKGTIKSQILLVFFLPILLACVHIGFAFPAIRRILRALGLVNTPLMIGCLIATVAVYVIGYGVIYRLTARTYYRIISN